MELPRPTRHMTVVTLQVLGLEKIDERINGSTEGLDVTISGTQVAQFSRLREHALNHPGHHERRTRTFGSGPRCSGPTLLVTISIAQS